MIRPPFLARVAAGVALTIVEETRRLPTTAIALPMTSVSLMLQTTMRLQQAITGLAIKGDEALSFMYPTSEQPAWAVFDEDQPAPDSPTADAASSRAGDNGGIGRFALYSTPIDAVEAAEPAAKEAAAKEATAKESATSADGSSATVVETLNYDGLTLAQLRSRLRSLSAADLDALLAHERSGAARSPYLTMLENRIASIK